MESEAGKRKTPHYRVSTWNPQLVESFLQSHNFRWVDMTGDDVLWIGKTPETQDSQVAFPRQRKELTPGTMRDSVMRQSGYTKKHWDHWRSLDKANRKRCLCCINKVV